VQAVNALATSPTPFVDDRIQHPASSPHLDASLFYPRKNIKLQDIEAESPAPLIV
jgi:hypothetical protein